MPPYDCMFLFKPHIRKEAIMDLVVRVGKHVSGRNGVVTDIKSLGTVQLGYGVRKLDGRYYQVRLIVCDAVPIVYASLDFYMLFCISCFYVSIACLCCNVILI